MLRHSYDSTMTFWVVLRQWKHTMLPMVLSKPLVWFLFVVELVLLTVDQFMLLKSGVGLPTLQWNAAMVRTAPTPTPAQHAAP